MVQHAYASGRKHATHRGLIRQIIVQAMAVLLFWWPVDALVRAAIEIYEDFDLELPVKTINFVERPGAAGVGAVTLGMTLVRWRKRGVEALAWRRPPV